VFGLKKKINDYQAMQIFMKEIVNRTTVDCPQIMTLMQEYKLFDYEIQKYDAEVLIDRVWTAWLLTINTINIYQSFEQDDASHLYDAAYLYFDKVLNKDNQPNYIYDLAREFESRYLMLEKVYETIKDNRSFPPVATLMIVISTLSKGAYAEVPTIAIKACTDFRSAFEKLNKVSADSQNIWRLIRLQYGVEKV